MLSAMSRPLRIELAGGLYHVTSRGDRREAMARAFQTGVYSMQEIADYFGVHYSTVSRAVRRLEGGNGSATRSAPRRANA
jgi:transposase